MILISVSKLEQKDNRNLCFNRRVLFSFQSFFFFFFVYGWYYPLAILTNVKIFYFLICFITFPFQRVFFRSFFSCFIFLFFALGFLLFLEQTKGQFLPDVFFLSFCFVFLSSRMPMSSAQQRNSLKKFCLIWNVNSNITAMLM